MTTTEENPVEVKPDDNVLSALRGRLATEPTSVALRYRDGSGFVSMTVEQMMAEVEALGAGLAGAGVDPGDRVVIFSAARLEWALLDYAIWQAGGVTVTIYETSSADQVRWILEDSGASTAIVETAEMRAMVEAARPSLPELGHVFPIDDGDLDELRRHGGDVDDAELARRALAIDQSAPATLVYTSGTTGRPKGCTLTHRNLIWTMRQVAVTTPELTGPGNRTLTFLPLAHILARVVQLTAITGGVPVAFGGGIATLLDDLAEVKPTWLTVVPRVLEKVYEGAAQKAGSGLKRRIFDGAVNTAKDVQTNRVEGRDQPWLLKARYQVADRLVFGAIREAMGGELTHVISGGAPLRRDLCLFFSGMGVEVLEGYGLTESTGPATVHRPGAVKPGTVGPPLPGVDVRIAEGGEIQLAGDLITEGYWHNPEETAKSFDGKWFRTGDIGEIDEDGHVVITGRMKDLIVTAGGKNVSPGPFETALSSNPLIDHAVVIGDEQRFIAALITLDPEGLAVWAEKHERDVSAPDQLVAELASDDAVRSELQAAIDDVNRGVSHAEQIKSFEVLETSFTVESGELTPTMKVKRAAVMKNQTSAISHIYQR
ncbi:MAG: AMP-dependent synthetase/ligase [Acidimicrobiales bacterium]